MKGFLRSLMILSGLCLVFAGAWLLANPDDETVPGLFVRGDTNNDGKRDISDAVFLLNYLFGGGGPPPCREVMDINDDGNRDISDAVFMLHYLFTGGDQPPPPYPECGEDPGGKGCVQSYCNA